MNLKLNVIRFNNEDVIATSAAIDCTGLEHIMLSGLNCANSNDGHNANFLVFYDGDLGDNNDYRCTASNNLAGLENNVWYHVSEEQQLVKCTKNHETLNFNGRNTNHKASIR